MFDFLIDIDECSRGSANCLRSETCFNTKGGYKCVNITCPENYAKLPKRYNYLFISFIKWHDFLTVFHYTAFYCCLYLVILFH